MSYLDPLTLMLNLVFMCQLCDVFCHQVIYSSVWKAIIFYWGKWFGIVDRSLCDYVYCPSFLCSMKVFMLVNLINPKF